MSKKNKVKLSQKQQLKNLEKRFGTNLDHIEVTVPMTHDEVLSYFGPQCEDYEPLCTCCNAWIEWNKTYKVTVSLSRDSIIKALFD